MHAVFDIAKPFWSGGGGKVGHLEKRERKIFAKIQNKKLNLKMIKSEKTCLKFK